MKKIISEIILMILVMDPIGNLPVFISLLKNFKPIRRKIILIREMFISLLLMILFLFIGEHILNLLNLKPETISISGGLILLFISIKMIFPDSKINDNKIIYEEPFLIPLSIPLIVGPSLLATIMILSHNCHYHILHLIFSLFISWLISFIILMLSDTLLIFFGNKGINILEKLVGLILIMLSIQMFLDGIKVWLKI
ncbi:putative antibiotic transporter [Candidatus Annandia adelgestsuga]|uniref:UPF0056 membrane protein n=1 Tax=Candidatus Annandia adelgestsuga TaxID=1302411 RepID=A0A3S9J7L7_9ENTR|nr:YhgN family NAAT transporter [Candidatus Annandia adelgestsuga]AZP36280.1 putative antibiotic transporter [Candidatus Annandia adelgestsuga]